jgi:PAS domain S-box-containing protein
VFGAGTPSAAITPRMPVQKGIRSGTSERLERLSNSRRLPDRATDITKPSLVVIVDDDPLVRAELTSILESAGYLAESYGDAEALLATDWATRAACLLLDAALPGISGVSMLKLLAKTGVRVPVIMITGSADVKKAVRAMKAGACDFIEKPASEATILAAVASAIGDQSARPTLDTLQLKAAQFKKRLTPRQSEILQRIIDGQANKNIAFELGIRQRTVENHRAQIMRKSGVKSLAALARMMFAADISARSSPVGSAASALGPVMAGDTESDRFERYFDQIPLAVIVATMGTPERVIYANPAFEALSGQSRDALEGQPWNSVRGVSLSTENTLALADAIQASSDLVGTFRIDRSDQSIAIVDVFSNVILDDDDEPTFRLAALVDVGTRDSEKLQEIELLIREKDTRLLEIQHRVKNNLQMITALIRIEARKAQGQLETTPFDRLAGRINAIQLVYKLLSEGGNGDEIDLGVYLSEVASSIMHSSAVEGIRLALKIDSFPVSVNVALPTGMVVNELLTNALKHAFVDRDGGTITLESLADARGCRVVVSDDGVGLPPDISWPKHGKLSALIVRSLRQNASADIRVESKRGKGTRFTIAFPRMPPRRNQRGEPRTPERREIV